MNPKERYMAVFSDEGRKKLDRVPTFVQGVKEGFYLKYEEQMFDEFEGELIYAVNFDAPYVLGFDAVFAGVPSSVSVEPIEVEINGKKHKIGESGQLSHPGSTYYKGGAIKEIETLEKLFAGMKIHDNSKALNETITYYESISDKIFPVVMIGGIFDRVWQALGMTTFSRHLRKRTKLYTETIRYFSEIMEANVQGLIDATGDRAGVVNILDDVAFKGRPMIAPEIWDRDFLPPYKKVCDIIKDAGLIPQMHSDGDVTQMVPSFQKAGFRGLQGWEGGADPYYINEHFPDFVVIGFGDVSEVLPYGTIEEVENHVKDLMNALKENRHFIIGPSTVIMKEKPLENVKAFMRAAYKYGKY